MLPGRPKNKFESTLALFATKSLLSKCIFTVAIGDKLL
jgi:hypothetical protein